MYTFDHDLFLWLNFDGGVVMDTIMKAISTLPFGRGCTYLFCGSCGASRAGAERCSFWCWRGLLWDCRI